MDTKTSYEITEVTCKKSDCNLKFNVVTSSIKTVVARPVEEVDFALLRENSITKISTISDYIVVYCPDGHKQRVFLKSK